MPLSPLPEILLAFGFPLLALWAARRLAWARTVGPAALCYLGGILVANLPGVTPAPEALEPLAWGTVSLSIPLLLFSIDFPRWFRLARGALVAFGLAATASAAVPLVLGMLLGSRIPHGPEVSGMLTGVYIGGTPNMAALAAAFGVPGDIFVSTNAADLLWSAVYLTLVMSMGPRWISRWFPRPPAPAPAEAGERWSPEGPARWRHRGLGLVLAGACAGMGALAFRLVPGDSAMAVAVLVTTTLASGCSLIRSVRLLPGTWSLGQYLLLAFCTAAGAMADMGRLAATGPAFLGYTAAVIGLTTVLQFLLMGLFRVDRDTAIITSVATIMSPPFVVPVADRLGNREVLLTGILSGLVGYAVGNYLGIGVTAALRWWGS